MTLYAAEQMMEREYFELRKKDGTDISLIENYIRFIKVN
jgi:hypothetical protein